MSPGQSHEDPPGAPFQDRSDFEKFEPNLAHRSFGKGCAGQRLAQRREQQKRKRVQDQSEAIGCELVAASPARKKVELEFLDPVLAVATLAILSVEFGRFAIKICDDEAGVVALFHRLGFNENASRPRPSLSGIGSLAKHTGAVLGLVALDSGLFHQRLGHLLKAWVPGQRNQVRNPFFLAALVHLGQSKPRIASKENLSVRKRLFERPDRKSTR